ncbi:hypothetical protein TNCV_3420501 [Trichonephila clavipes]|nr:hypothetical protein TNCV_3420501 [Trichonephila clavipes]
MTDHNPLVWLNRNVSSNPRLMRWALALQPYNFRIVHRSEYFIGDEGDKKPCIFSSVSSGVVSPHSGVGRSPFTPRNLLEVRLAGGVTFESSNDVVCEGGGCVCSPSVRGIRLDMIGVTVFA